MIELTDVSKAYGSVQALSGASLNVAAGEIVGLLGPNGAGKTTMIKILTGYLQPDSGTVRVDGLDVLNQRQQAQSKIGYLPENAPLYPELSVQNYLQMIARLRNVPEADQVAFISDAVLAVGLEGHLTRPIGTLSKGFRQRLGLAQAILHKPRLLILDEPTVGLDPTQIVEIRNLIRELAKSSTVLFSTHILPEVEMLCDRVVILINGEIKADSRLTELEQTTNAVLVLSDTVPDIHNSLMQVPGVQRVEAFDTRDGLPAYRIFGSPDVDINPLIFNLAAQHDWPVRELKSDVRLLEAVFTELTTAA